MLHSTEKLAGYYVEQNGVQADYAGEINPSADEIVAR